MSASGWSVSWSSFFFSSRRRHTRSLCDWSSDVCSSDLVRPDITTDELDQLAESFIRSHPGAQPSFKEIGRASCRERVEMSGVGGSLVKDNGNVALDVESMIVLGNEERGAADTEQTAAAV